MFGAESFSQKMLRFEEFGIEPMPEVYIQGATTYPTPLGSSGGPAELALMKRFSGATPGR